MKPEFKISFLPDQLCNQTRKKAEFPSTQVLDIIAIFLQTGALFQSDAFESHCICGFLCSLSVFCDTVFADAALE